MSATSAIAIAQVLRNKQRLVYAVVKPGDINDDNNATITTAQKGSVTYGGGNQTNLLAAIDSREISQSSGGRNFHWQVNQSQGSKTETLHMTQVNVPVAKPAFVQIK